MKVHHLNCTSLHPPGGRLMDGESGWFEAATLVCHCLLVETEAGLLLVDTGFGLRDVARPRSRLSPFMLKEVRPELREELTAVRQVEALGFQPEDVRHVALTHLDFDHAGGLDDFPRAQVHLLEAERNAAFAQRTLLDRMRYRPAQWSSEDHWRTYRPDQGERWFGFQAVRQLEGVPPEVLVIPLAGHTLGHAGVAIQTDDGWLLNAGDAYFFHGEMGVEYRCPAGLRAYQTQMEKDRGARMANQHHLRQLVRQHSAEVTVFCSHDRREFERLAGRAADEPARRAVQLFEHVTQA